MKPFKFFQKGTLDDPQMLNESTHITASFYNDRIDIERQRIVDAETAYRFRSRGAGRASGIIHTDNHGNTDYVPFFTNGPRVTRPKPNWLQRMVNNVYGIMTLSLLITVTTIAVIAKILNVW